MRETAYQFRRRLESVHVADRRNLEIRPETDEILVEHGWQILISDKHSRLVLNVAKDLQAYLLESMQVSVLLMKVPSLSSRTQCNDVPSILLGTKEDLPNIGSDLSLPRSYRIQVGSNRVIVCGRDPRGVGQGSYYLEDLMNMRQAPVLKRQDVTRQPVFSPRMAHSGWGIDQFPDAHLNAMAHHGLDAILVFSKGVDHTAMGYQDLNNLVDRAESFGLDVYLYMLLQSGKHPDEPDAEAYYEGTYGALFEACPRAKGIILVGESIEFPSKDPNTTGRLRLTPSKDGLPPTKPSPGWWPCRDYPQWVNLIKKVVRRHNPEADIVFWTYNWGWTPSEQRLALIRALPTDITLLVTFEMFEQIRREGVTHVCVDYTISFEGPSTPFETEAQTAHERGLRLYAMSNTGGMTWDFGVIPYVPVPFQWARRHTALLKAHETWGLSGLMESHLYGWWPSFVSELAKAAYWRPAQEPENVLRAMAHRDYSEEAVPLVLQAWKYCSDAIRNYIPTNEDQYGPFRIGPSYPLIFHPNFSLYFSTKGLKPPAAWHALHGSAILCTPYAPSESARQSPGPCRLDVEIRSLHTMSDLWRKGIQSLEKALTLTPEKKRPTGEELLNLSRFVANCITTTLHVKQWWKLNQQLMTCAQPSEMGELLDGMIDLANREIRNAEETIPLVEKDSRLGWEPCMDYMTDANHLKWKIAQVRTVLDYEIPEYRKSIAVTTGSEE